MAEEMETSTPEWRDATQEMFDKDHDGFKWDDLYNGADDRLDKHIFRSRRDFAVDCALQNTPEDGRILDMGCGAGPFLEKIALKRSCVGLDNSQDLLQFAESRLQSRNIPVSLRFGDCQSTNLDSASFDFVNCLGVISYVENYPRVLDEISRLLKPNGVAIISARNKHRPVASDPVRLLRYLVKKPFSRNESDDASPGRFMDPDRVEKSIAASGLVIRQFHGIGYGPFKLLRMKLLSDAADIRMNDWLTERVGKSTRKWPMRKMADVHLWVCEKNKQ